MKKISAFFMLSLSLVLGMAMIPLHAEESESTTIGIEVGVEYDSTYFWRGQDFYYDGTSSVGVFFPWVRYYTPVEGLSVGVTGEVPEDSLGDRKNQYTNYFVNWTGIDYDITYSKKFMDDKIGLKLKPFYYMYPGSYSDKYGALEKNDSTGLIAAVAYNNDIITPTLTCTYTYRISDTYYGAEVESQFKDIYLQFQLAHNFTITETSSIDLGANVAYWYAGNYSDGIAGKQNGFSDATAFTQLNVTSGNAGFYGGFNYSLSLIKDKLATEGIKYPAELDHYYWAKFGAYYTF